jgi:hypothetical protein
MLPTELRSLPYSGMYRALGNIFVPIVGAMLLFVIGLQFSRGSDVLTLASITGGVMLIGFSYYSFRRVLNRLGGKIDEGALSKLLVAANLMAIFAYLICIFALDLGSHH